MSEPRWHTTLVSGIPFTVERRFTPLRLLGQGAYGIVCAADNVESGEHVAIKKMANIVDAARSSLLEGKRALRELLLLRRKHEPLEPTL